ncbi:ribbon-helix-helix protein, CopG family [Skermania sp. ID1734]|uniref:ribbon-helix-helix protein, CopG family n=1 Tax=Skermania sp. ID1734 TaxID=2597516 RepID=UPI0011802E88|nr:ribbon-helix-helix protein, CopG family [Skermania sp. ID1734]TSE01071.1 ribbon-helix-helix protein, CopG family [Skermania sp. ID1734]
MRTTVRLDDDVLAAAEQLRRERHIGLSEAVNELARAGIGRQPAAKPFRQRTHRLRISIDVSNVAEAIEYLDGNERT